MMYAIKLKDYTMCSTRELEVGDVYSLYKDGELLGEGLLVVGEPNYITSWFSVLPTKKIF